MWAPTLKKKEKKPSEASASSFKPPHRHFFSLLFFTTFDSNSPSAAAVGTVRPIDVDIRAARAVTGTGRRPGTRALESETSEGG